MSKKINIEINTCSECPYYGYNNEFEEHKCNLLDKLLFYSDTNFNGKEIIFKDCTLDEVCNCECITEELLNGNKIKVFECENCKQK